MNQMLGRKVDVSTFIDAFLLVCADVDEIRCTLTSDRQRWRVEARGAEPCEIDLDSALGKFRACCARLAVLCQESGQDVSPYGGEGVIERLAAPNHKHVTWKLQFTNTPGQQEFTLTKQLD